MTTRVDSLSFTFVPVVDQVKQSSIDQYKDIFEGNRHRVYSLAYYMTDSELVAEDVLSATFCRAFAKTSRPTAEVIDRALVTELREQMPIGTITLRCVPATDVASVRRNTRRVDLERAVVQLPATERMIFLMHDVENYDHSRIARTLGITETEARDGLFQARLKIRELLAAARS